MNPFSSRGAAHFARLLDSGSPAGSAPGLALVAQLRTAGAALDGAVAPRPEFRDALRRRLMAVATVQAAQVAAPRALSPALSWRRRGSAVAAGAMATVVAVSGVAVAGGQSLPGDPFYGVKRTTEAFQLRMADGDVEKGTRHLDFAATRLREVRGLTLGRDAVDAGPALGPAALSGGLSLRSAERPLAEGAALGAGVAERVRDTLADMDEQTREGSGLLTAAYRSSQAAAPLRALNRFATRQTTGLEQLLPVLPPASRTQARASLALLTDVSDSTEELLRIGTCGDACDPTSAAPVVPSEPGAPAAPEATGSQDCECPEPAPAPLPQGTPTPAPTPRPSAASPEPTRSPPPTPTTASPSPSPSPTSEPLLPLPSLPVPVPTLPVPVPSITLPPLEPVVEPVESALDPLLPGISGNAASGSSPVPAPAPSPTPVPQLAPLPPRD